MIQRPKLWGFLHGLVQLAAMLLVVAAYAGLRYKMDVGIGPDTIADLTLPEKALAYLGLRVVVFLLLFVIGVCTGGIIMGLYLWISLNLFRIHQTESFSSMRIQDYKNFLRMHVTEEGLTIYPIKLERVGKKWRKVAKEKWEPEDSSDSAAGEPALIQEPIFIKAAVVEHRKEAALATH
jgi:hypothetical protein